MLSKLCCLCHELDAVVKLSCINPVNNISTDKLWSRDAIPLVYTFIIVQLHQEKSQFAEKLNSVMQRSNKKKKEILLWFDSS